MKYALIGCGRIAANHIKAAKDNMMKITALCDIIPDSISALIQRSGLAGAGIKSYTDYRKLLSEAKPDVAAIATESGNHGEIAKACIEAGVHIIVEKPITLSLTEADEIIELAERKKVKLCACHQNRFNVSIQHMRKALEAGRFGRLSHGCVHVRWNRNRGYYSQAPWRGTWAQDGGALMNQSIHGLDLLRWMMGDEIEEVFAYTARQFHPYLECEDLGLAVVKFKNGAFGTMEGTTNVFPENLEETLYLFGDRGTAKAGGKSANTIEVWRFADSQPGDALLTQGMQENTSDVYGNGHTPLYADMVESIIQDRSPYVDGRAGRRAVELVLAIYKSAAEEHPVKLPLDNCASTDFIGRFD